MIETWGFYIFGLSKKVMDAGSTTEDYQRVFDRYLDLWPRCEGWGFDGLTFAEHHFNASTISPSVNLLVAAVAARTTTLKFTTLGAVLPLNDARRYAEECGMLQYMTNGRFEPGIAPGAGVIELAAIGIPPEESRPRYYSGADLLQKAMAGGPVTHKDAFYNLEKVPLEPPIRLRPDQAVWVTVLSPDSAAWAAERGYRMCTAWSKTDIAAAVAGRYYEAADAAGRKVDPSMLGLRRRVFVADSDALAQELAEEAGDLVQAHAGTAFESLDPAIFKMLMDPDDYAIGSPETVAERLIDQCQAGGFGHLVCFTDFGDFAEKDLYRSHELIGTKVAPILRKAKVEGGKRAASANVDAHGFDAAHGRMINPVRLKKDEVSQ
ncbi:LLM class flavin-dependent oxidoreductase [Mycobacterium palustre]|nr:LLM class flavin-dependent oxidoreductase [Mycobacterium palustre]